MHSAGQFGFSLLQRARHNLNFPALKIVDSVPGVAYILMTSIVISMVVVNKLSRNSKLDAFPTVGWTIWPGSWIFNATNVIQEGYNKYKSMPFKVADRFNWIIVLGNPKHLEEVRKAPENVFSFHEAARDELKTRYTMPPEVHHNPYHYEVVRSYLNRNLASIYNEMQDEVSVAFDEVLELKGHAWKSVSALATIQQVVCRASNRAFVGLPLCRDPDWVDLNMRYALDVVHGAFILKIVPDFLAPFVIKFMTNIPENIKHGMRLLGPTIEKRLRLKLEERVRDRIYKPNDALSWLLESTPNPEHTVRHLTNRILAINFFAILTTSISFTHALFYLAGNPQYIKPLREEVESIVRKEGWSKASIEKMYKVDSFLKECQRLAGITTTSLTRKVVKDFTFSDGTFIPKGTIVTASSQEIHLDDKLYHNAHEFDPFRFSDLRREDGQNNKHEFASTSLGYLPFGHGKDACPGRYFAVSELKTMLAHIVASYDIKFEDNKAQPKETILGTAVVPDATAKVMFRKRVQ